MNNDSESLLTTADKPPRNTILSAVAVFILGIFVFGGFYVGYQSWNKKDSQSTGTQETEIMSVDLPSAFDLKGYIYLEGFMSEKGMNTFAINLDTKQIEEITSLENNWGFSQIDDSHALINTIKNSNNEEDTQIVVRDYKADTKLQLKTPEGYYKRNLNAFEFNNTDALVYAARTQLLASSSAFYDPTMWQVVVGVPQTNSYDIISGAFSPVMVAGRNEILYLKADDMYVYNLSTKKSYSIDTVNNLFNADSEIAISDDYSKLIIVTPSESLISIYNIILGEVMKVELTSSMVVEERHYFSPVISPDGTQYALYGFSNFMEPTDALVEIRTFGNENPVASFEVNPLDYKSVRLNSWKSSLITQTAHEHHAEGTTN